MKRYFLNIRAFHITVAVAAAVLVPAGCGGSDSSEATANGRKITVQTGTLTKAQFIKRADVICEEGRSEWEEKWGVYLAQNKAGSQAERAAGLVKTVLAPIFEKEIDRISSLGAPSGDEDQVAAILNAMQQALDEGMDQPQQFLDSKTPLGEATKLASEYGFTSCGEP